MLAKLKILFLATVMVAALSESADAQSATLEGSILHDPTLSEEFLLPPRQPSGRPSLRVKHYDNVQGLMAGYETVGGKRILFYARSLPNGAVLAGAYHWDESRQSIWPLMGPSIEESPDDGKQRVTMVMAGVKIPGVLSEKAAGRAQGAEGQRLKQFLRGQTGLAFSDGVIAMYTLLEPFEDGSPTLARFKMPFGAMRMAAEMATGQYAGFDHADELLGKGQAERMRNACKPGQCEYRGRQFMIHSSGLFDMLSSHGKPIPGQGKASVQCSLAPSRAGLSAVTTADALDGQCHGCCGPECWGCTGIDTPECLGHDDCVLAYGHLACAYSTPDECDGCNTVIEAIGSLIGVIGGAIADWLGFFTDDDSPFGGECDLSPCLPGDLMGY